MANGPSEEFEDFDAIAAKEQDNNDFEPELDSGFEDIDIDSPVDENGIPEPDDAGNGLDYDTEMGEPEKKSFFKKNKALLIFMGVGTPLILGSMFAFLPSGNLISNNNNTSGSFQSSQFSKRPTNPANSQNAQTNEYLGASNVPENVPVESQVSEPNQTTIIKGLSEEDVLNLVEPMALQISELINALSQQNKYIQSLPSQVESVPNSLTQENLTIIKRAINTGLTRTEESFKKELVQLLSKIEVLSSKVTKLEQKTVQVVKRQLTMVTSIEGKVRVQIDGTNEIQEIVKGTVLRGYGYVKRVGPWGCIYFEDGSQYEPSRASCAIGQ
jgi:hypothetical protein